VLFKNFEACFSNALSLLNKVTQRVKLRKKYSSDLILSKVNITNSYRLIHNTLPSHHNQIGEVKFWQKRIIFNVSTQVSDQSSMQKNRLSDDCWYYPDSKQIQYSNDTLLNGMRQKLSVAPIYSNMRLHTFVIINHPITSETTISHHNSASYNQHGE